jgi:hypothetical protein
MSFVSANDHPTQLSPKDPLYYAPRSVRTDPRSNAIQQMGSDHLPPSSTSHFDKIHEEASTEFTRSRESEFIYQRGRSRALLAIAGGITAAIAVIAVGALVFFTLFPESKSIPSELTASISTPASATPAKVISEDSQALLQGFMKFQTMQTETPEHAGLELRPVGPVKDGSEKPQALLEKFIQWQQKKERQE